MMRAHTLSRVHAQLGGTCGHLTDAHRGNDAMESLDMDMGHDPYCKSTGTALVCNGQTMRGQRALMIPQRPTSEKLSMCRCDGVSSRVSQMSKSASHLADT